MCTLTKDIHYLCPRKPFIKDNTAGICSLQPMSKDSHCPLTAAPHYQVTTTQAKIVGNWWLINTPRKVATLTYDRHDTATCIELTA